MAQKKETKKQIKVRDLKPRKDAKGGFMRFAPTHQQSPGHSPTGPGGQHGTTAPGGNRGT